MSRRNILEKTDDMIAQVEAMIAENEAAIMQAQTVLDNWGIGDSRPDSRIDYSEDVA